MSKKKMITTGLVFGFVCTAFGHVPYVDTAAHQTTAVDQIAVRDSDAMSPDWSEADEGRRNSRTNPPRVIGRPDKRYPRGVDMDDAVDAGDSEGMSDEGLEAARGGMRSRKTGYGDSFGDGENDQYMRRKGSARANGGDHGRGNQTDNGDMSDMKGKRNGHKGGSEGGGVRGGDEKGKGEPMIKKKPGGMKKGDMRERAS